jgi:hypothetical protein
VSGVTRGWAPCGCWPTRCGRLMTTTLTQAEAGEPAPDAVRVNALLAELRVAGNAVGNKEWLSAELAGEPVVSLGMLGSTARLLSALDSAGSASSPR